MTSRTDVERPDLLATYDRLLTIQPRPDPRIAALAEALMTTDAVPMPDGWLGYQDWAERILAALDGWTLISDEDMIDGWKARDEERAADLARLRKIEEAAAAYLQQPGRDKEADALRAALEAER